MSCGDCLQPTYKNSLVEPIKQKNLRFKDDDDHKWTSLGDISEKIKNFYEDSTQWKNRLPIKYDEDFSTGRKIKGFIGFVIAVSIVALYVLCMTGNIFDFPEKIASAFQHINYKHLAIGLSVTSILVGGTVFVIIRVLTKKDPHIDAKIGKLTGSSHIKEAVFCFPLKHPQGDEACFTLPKKINNCYLNASKGHGDPTTQDDKGNKYSLEILKGYVDVSTLDENGNGKAYLYFVKTCKEHYQVSTVIAITSPFYFIGVIVADVLRLAIVPFYITFCMLIESCRKDPLFSKYENERKFCAKDILIATRESIFRLVKAPFYAIAFCLSAVYSIFDPFNGRKFGSFLERDWNQDVQIKNGFWSVGGPQDLWPGWKIIAPNGLHENAAYFLAGCWQQVGIVEFENHEIVRSEQTFMIPSGQNKGPCDVFLAESVGQILEEDSEVVIEEARALDNESNRVF